LALLSFTLGALVIVTGWHVEPLAWGAGTASLFGQSQVQVGERLFSVYCASCHGLDRPASITYPPRHDATGHTWQHPDCQLLAIVRDGGDDMTRAMRASQAPPGMVEMAAFKDRLTDDEIVAVLAYIKTLWTPEERQFQEQVTRTSCRTG
jgi:S-disulfanyl-L-cysteine oxidoreductase SoxD